MYYRRTKNLRLSWECISSIVLVLDSWLSFVRGTILFIPNAASENEINASWLIILGVRNDGLWVPCGRRTNIPNVTRSERHI